MKITVNSRKAHSPMNISDQIGTFVDRAGDIWTRTNQAHRWFVFSPTSAWLTSLTPEHTHGPYREVVFTEIIVEEKL